MPRFRTLGGLFDLDGLQEAIADNESKMADPDFWNNQEEAQKVINENNELKNKYDNFNQLEEAIEDLEVLLEMVQEEDDDELVSELSEKFELAQKKMQEYQLSLLLNGKYDKDNAILELHPGAGGTESQDWDRCCSECILVGQNSTGSVLKRMIIKLETRPESSRLR